MNARHFATGVRHLGALAVCAVWLLTPAPRAAAQEIGALVSPGPLARAHANLEGIANCQKCHEPGRKVTAAKCLACHKPIAERIAAKKGVHRNVTDDCVSCHVEHAGVDAELRPLDVKKFNHAEETGFPLDGKHAAIAADCAKCHKTRSFLGLKADCASCHQDPHRGTLGPNCATCHSTAVAFKETEKAFDHSKTAFPLSEAHLKVACAKCHVNKVYKGIKFALCTDCHKDPHQQAFGAACAGCHTGATWKTDKVDHSKTRFALLGKHKAVACVSCHRQPPTRVKLAFDRCAVCHADPHKGVFKQDCVACHTVDGFKSAAFDHGAKTKFALTGRHAELPCASCHKGAGTTGIRGAPLTVEFGGLSTACASCHTDVHAGKLGTGCASCHGSTTFRIEVFKHPNAPEFYGGQHASVACAKCHGGEGVTKTGVSGKPVAQRLYRGLAAACATCHKDVHLGQLGTRCETCHSVAAAKFAAPGFSHAASGFELTGKHATLACAQCHRREIATYPSGVGEAVHFKGIGTACASCHKDVHLGQLGSTCQSCHGTDSFKLPNYKHAGNPEFHTGKHATARCQACHTSVEGDFPAGHGTAVRFAKLSSACASCHEDVHKGTLGTRCESCHTTRQWPGASRAFHKATTFPLERHAPRRRVRLLPPRRPDEGDTEPVLRLPLDSPPGRPLPDPARHRLRELPSHDVVAVGDLEPSGEAPGLRSPAPTRRSTASHATAISSFTNTVHRLLLLPPAGLREGNPAQPRVRRASRPTCNFCHRVSDTSWQQALFDHARTPFPLLGRPRRRRPCVACHANNVFKGTPTTCYRLPPDRLQQFQEPATTFRPVSRQRARPATRSPTPVGAQAHLQPRDDGFPLARRARDPTMHGVPRRRRVQGQRPPRASPATRSDYDSTTNPNHAAAGFPTTCETCHKATRPHVERSPSSTTPASSRSSACTPRPPCASCHINNNYTTVPTTRASAATRRTTRARRRPVNHAGLPTTCDSCHNNADAAWTLASSFNHATYFPLAGAHATARRARLPRRRQLHDRADEPVLRLPRDRLHERHHAGEPRRRRLPDDVRHLPQVLRHLVDAGQLQPRHASSRSSACTPRRRARAATSTTTTRPCRRRASAATPRTTRRATTPVNHAGACRPPATRATSNADAAWTLASSFNHATVLPARRRPHARAACASCHVGGNYTTVPTSPCYALPRDRLHERHDAGEPRRRRLPDDVRHLPQVLRHLVDAGHASTTPASSRSSACTPRRRARAATSTTTTRPCRRRASAATSRTTRRATTPVNHAGLPTTCDSCHNNADAAWTLASSFNHATYFPLAGAHTTAACASCHVGGNYTTVPTSPCYACHATDYTNADHAGEPRRRRLPDDVRHLSQVLRHLVDAGQLQPRQRLPARRRARHDAVRKLPHQQQLHDRADDVLRLPHQGLPGRDDAGEPRRRCRPPATRATTTPMPPGPWRRRSTTRPTSRSPAPTPPPPCASCHVGGNYTTVPTSPCYACHATDYTNAIDAGEPRRRRLPDDVRHLSQVLRHLVDAGRLQPHLVPDESRHLGRRLRSVPHHFVELRPVLVYDRLPSSELHELRSPRRTRLRLQLPRVLLVPPERTVRRMTMWRQR